MEIIASTIFGRSAFIFGRIRIIRFTLQVGGLSIKQDLQTRPSKKDSVEFFATYRDEYKSKYPRTTIDMVAFALRSNQEPSLASEF